MESGVFNTEIEELLKEADKRNDKAKIKKALANDKQNEADVLFKYSSLSINEYEEIKKEDQR